MNYYEYIRSNAWQRKRRQYFASKMWKTYPTGRAAGKHVCYVCGSDDRLDLHHRTYKRLGKERSTIANFLRILKLPRPVIELLQKEELSFGHAKVLAGEKDREK